MPQPRYEDDGGGAAAHVHDAAIFDNMMSVLPDLHNIDPHPVVNAAAAAIMIAQHQTQQNDQTAHAIMMPSATTDGIITASIAQTSNMTAHEAAVAVKAAVEAGNANNNNNDNGIVDNNDDNDNNNGIMAMAMAARGTSTLAPAAGGAYAEAAAAGAEDMIQRALREEGMKQQQQYTHRAQRMQEQQQPQPQIVLMPEVMIAPKWLTRFDELKHYKDLHHNFNVPVNYEKHKHLSAWVRTQKQQYKLLNEGKPNHMSQARIDLLNSVGFEWTGIKRDKFWNDRYVELVAFHGKFGTTRIPEKYDAAPQLHTWVSLQRRQLKMCKEGRPTKLTEERVRLLEVVGLECGIRASTTWMDRFMELKRYKDEFSDCEVPQKYKANPSLGRWVDNQKTQHQKLYDGKSTHMTIERIQLLVSIGFNWRKKV